MSPFDETGRETPPRRLAEELRAGYRGIAGEEAPTEEEVVEALRTLGAALSQVAKAVETAGRDETVRRHLTNAVSSLGDAASAFLSEFTSAADDTAHHRGEATG